MFFYHFLAIYLHIFGGFLNDTCGTKDIFYSKYYIVFIKVLCCRKYRKVYTYLQTYLGIYTKLVFFCKRLKYGFISMITLLPGGGGDCEE